MILNLLLILFIILMIYYWGAVQGLFSSLLHLVAVILAGALAFAFWEPLAMILLGRWLPQYAWGLALLIPFLLALAILRILYDMFIPANMYFSQIINITVGGFFGLCSAILTAGILLIGIGMLPLPAVIWGWQPMMIENGQPRPAPWGLWIPADRMTSSFYAMLSHGALAPGFPSWNGRALELYRGDLARTAALLRLRPDDNASIVATPASVSLSTCYIHPLPMPDLPESLVRHLTAEESSSETASKLVVLDTRWEVTRPTYDEDQALRVYPGQVQLIGWQETFAGRQVHSFLPRAVGRLEQTGDAQRICVLFDSETSVGRLNGRGQLAWIFVVPEEVEPKFVLIRNLRLEVPPPAKADTRQILAAIGALPRPAQAAAAPSTAPVPSLTPPPPGRHGTRAEDIALTNELPMHFSVNAAGTLQLTGNQVMSGTSTVSAPSVFISADMRVSSIYVPDHQAMIRVRLSRDEAQSTFGRAVTAAKMLQPIYLEDAQGQQYQPIGYVLHRPSTGTQEIRIDRLTPIRAARELPIPQMAQDDVLYLYFLVPKGTRIIAYHLGQQIRQEVNLDTRPSP